MTAAANPYLLSVHYELPEPELQFDPLNSNQCDIHPLKGLLKFGAYSESNPLVMPTGQIRVMTVVPEGYENLIEPILRLLSSSHSPYWAKEYFIEYTSFKAIFKKDIVVTGTVKIDSKTANRAESAGNPFEAIYDLYKDAIHSIRSRQDFDLLLIFIPEKWKGFIKGIETDFDLHDKIKAFAASKQRYCQIIEEWGDIYKSPDKCAVAWALSIALYTKAGGIPWALKSFDDSRAYIGIGYSLRQNLKDGKRFVVCCSQIFDSQGKGLNFVVFEATEKDFTLGDDRDNPFLSKSAMRKIMSRSLEIYSKRNKHGEAPKKISVHKTNAFTPEEIEGCKEAFYGMEDIELLHIQRKNDWKGMRILSKDRPDNNACRRGSYIPLENETALLWTQGAVELPDQKWPYYKEKRAIPNPLLLKKCLGNTGWSDGCQNILRLTKMNWNTEKLYNTMPVTIKCAQKLAEVIKHSEELAKTEYDYTLFM